MKILINENQLKYLIKEYIQPSEVYEDIPAIESICDGRRGVAFLTILNMDDETYNRILELVDECDLDSYEVPKNKHGAYVVFNRDYKDDAKELVEIAVNLGGYLKTDAPEHITRRIGEILNYDPQEVEKFIREKE